MSIENYTYKLQRRANVLVQINLDRCFFATRWEIHDSDGNPVMELEGETYTSPGDIGKTKNHIIPLDFGGEYTFILMDAPGIHDVSPSTTSSIYSPVVLCNT